MPNSQKPSPLETIKCERATARIFSGYYLIREEHGNIFLYKSRTDRPSYQLVFVWPSGKAEKKKECTIARYEDKGFYEVDKDLERIVRESEREPLRIREQPDGSYKLIDPELIRLAQEAVERQARKTPEDIQKAIEQIVEDVKDADD